MTLLVAALLVLGQYGDLRATDELGDMIWPLGDAIPSQAVKTRRPDFGGVHILRHRSPEEYLEWLNEWGTLEHGAGPDSRSY